MIIRLAQADDLPSIIDLAERLVSKSAWRHTSFDARACVNRLLQTFGKPVTEWLAVAEVDGKIVGAMLLVLQRYWWSSNEWYVMDDAFYTEYPGAGRKLINAGVRWSRSKGAREIIFALNGGIETGRTVRLFKRYGFVDRGICVSMSLAEVGEHKCAA